MKSVKWFLILFIPYVLVCAILLTVYDITNEVYVLMILGSVCVGGIAGRLDA